MPKMNQVPLSFSKMSNSKFDDLNSYVGHTKSHSFVDCYVSYRILSYWERGEKKGKIGNHQFKNFIPLAATSSKFSLMSGFHKMSSSLSI